MSNMEKEEALNLLREVTAPRETERKIVQISEGGALCNDGSVWRLYGGKDGVWYRMPTIPQDAAQ